MLASFLFGLLFGFLGLVAVEALALLWVIDRFSRKKSAPEVLERQEGRDLESERTFTYPCNKQGFVWVLAPEKVPKITDGSPTGGSKEIKNKKNGVEVLPIKKYAKIKDHSLILSDLDGSSVTLELRDCSVMAVSGSDLSSRKWAKRYPIRLERKESNLYNGSKTCYLYAETSWEKESWCKALRLASSPDMTKCKWYGQLSEEFHRYIASLNAEYPCFLKPSVLSGDAMDKTNRIDGSSKVRLFLKKLAKKPYLKTALESKASSGLSAQGERKIGDKLRASHGVSSTDVVIKSSGEEKSSRSSLQDLVQPYLPTSSLGYKEQSPTFPDAGSDEKLVNDEATLCWNLLLSRLFFDAKRSDEINTFIKARIQRTLSNLRTPTYIGEITCTALDLGNVPPYIYRMRVLPLDLNEVWAVEVDFEYSGGILLHIATRLEVHEPELQKDIIRASLETDSNGEVSEDFLEGIEHYGHQLKSSRDLSSQMENKDEVDGLKQSKSSSWTSSYMSRWKGILHSIADQVSQVPLSLGIKVTSIRGTLRIHIKAPPSDQLWFGFPSMPEIEWNLESSVGDRKITSSHIALLISNRFKAALRENLVLPNCESICMPWMLAEKDDWIPSKDAPFIWVSQETNDMKGLGTSGSQQEEAKAKVDNSNKSNIGSPSFDKKDEKIEVQQPTKEIPVESSSSHSSPIPSSQPSNAGTNEESMAPLLKTDKSEEDSNVSSTNFPENISSRAIVATEEQTSVPLEEDINPKRSGRRARMLDFGKRMGDKLEEKRRNIEEKSRHIVERMRENART
ncbi:uncharacterized protein [Typha angustifolia]|uniref:uncharacterized protein n=1 Tax=Typha angustifolia TaxID=59011 RepID=UPI003C2D69F4